MPLLFANRNPKLGDAKNHTNTHSSTYSNFVHKFLDEISVSNSYHETY